MSKASRGRKRIGAVIGAGSLIILAACGTRLPNSTIKSAAEGFPPAGAVYSNGAPVGVVNSGGAVAQGGSNAPVGVAPTGAVGATGASNPGVATSGPALTPGGGGSSSVAAAGGGGAASSAPAGGSGGGSTPCTKQGSTIVIGQDGSFSGLVGQSTGNIKLGLSVWAKYINSIGGLECHPVQLYQEDDGSDPSTAAANTTDLIQNKHAIAIVGSDTPIVVASEESAADQYGIPMVGGDLVTTTWNTDANLFPQGGSALQVDAGVMKIVAATQHVTKVGLLYCVEASVCGVVNQNFKKVVAPSKMTVVGTQAISLTQATYTAECQTMKSAGAQFIFTYLDSAGLARLATSCDSLNYHPLLGASAIALAPSVFADSSIQTDNMFYGNSFVPFTATGTPGLTTMHNAFKTYTGQDLQDENSVAGWTSGLLFAAAINALGPAARNENITPALVKQGLWSLKNDTLGGTVPPVTFVKGKPAPINPCYTVLQLTKSGQKTPGGTSFSCTNI